MPLLRHVPIALALTILWGASAASAQDRVFFPATENVTAALVDRINAETVRIDMAAWYLTERSISRALINRYRAGVPVRLLGDRGSIFEIDPRTKEEFYWLASQGLPIRLRYHPSWYPEIMHWKATIFVGQNIVTFGSANYTPFELAPVSSTNYKDEVVLFTGDPAVVNAFKTQFDRLWNDTIREPLSRISGPPYFLNWDDACAREAACGDYRRIYPNPAPMIINTARLEADHPLPPDLVWGQGDVFNSRLAAEIRSEGSFVDMVIYRLSVDEITNALLERHRAGVRVRLIIEPLEYRNRKWPEFWLTRAHIDRLWAAGVPIKQRAHEGLTHMKTLTTSRYTTVASANFTAAWQRDHNYFASAATKPAIYTAIRDRFQQMWSDPAGFTTFTPEPADAPVLQGPADSARDVSRQPTLVWDRAAFATSYDVYLGTSPGAMTAVANVPARLVNDPPPQYSWTPPTALAGATTYYWQIVSRTHAGLATASAPRSFTTGGPNTLMVSPTAITIGAAGGSGTIAVTASAGMGWSASSDAGWLTVSPVSGSGSATLTYAVARNSTASTRAASISVNGQRVAVTQEAGTVSAPSTPPPGAPQGLRWSVSGARVSISWQSGGGGAPTSHVIEAGLAPGRTDLALPSSGQTSVTYDGVPPGVFYVRVRAVNDAGSSPPSAEAVIYVGVPPPPAPPVNLSATVSGGFVTLAWAADGMSGAPSYFILEAGFTPGGVEIGRHGIAATSVGIGGVPPGVYYARVRAANATGWSAPSNEVRVVVR